MPPRKHKLDEGEESDSTTTSLQKMKSNESSSKPVKTKVEKKAKSEKLKKEKIEVDDEEEPNSTSSSQKTKNEPSKSVKAKTEKKAKSEKMKREKPEVKRAENSATSSKLGREPKEKIASLHGEEAIELMTNYLREQNRPYSATEISANLHGKVGKTVADKLLQKLSEMGQIKSKSTRGNEKGSQRIFWALQEDTDNIGPEELNQMDDKIKNLKESTKELKSKVKMDSKVLEKLKETPTTKELICSIENLREENKLKKQKLIEYQSGQNEMATRDEIGKVEKEFVYWTTKRIARKRAFQNLEDLLLENKTREELWEEAGIENDFL